MSDKPSYEFWDVTHKESSHQFKAYKEARIELEKTEKFYQDLLRNLLEVPENKNKSKIKFKLEDGDQPTIEIKTQKGKREPVCKEVKVGFPDKTLGVLTFDNKGEITRFGISEAGKKYPDRLIAITSMLKYGRPTNSEAMSLSDIKFSTEKPEDLSMKAYSHGSAGRTFEYRVSYAGRFTGSSDPFPRFVQVGLSSITPHGTFLRDGKPAVTFL